MEQLQKMGVNEFCNYLLAERGVHSDVVSCFSDNRISGATFLELSEDDLKDLLPVIGDRVNVRGLLAEAREVKTPNHLPSSLCIIIIMLHNNITSILALHVSSGCFENISV